MTLGSVRKFLVVRKIEGALFRFEMKSRKKVPVGREERKGREREEEGGRGKGESEEEREEQRDHKEGEERRESYSPMLSSVGNFDDLATQIPTRTLLYVSSSLFSAKRKNRKF